ncbi:hypothetical protein MTBBW1_150020 [Desulfamplus magnetovallimortis]|uniref:3-deoxy-D-manno-octulosonic acid transferase n=2 Tax=Desulfamplus magnetovallimortis TaxID=1246637 RepID=A0A1W1H8F7_9BACT|nr:hypothetical protein MTBBW1_150020 [Desulfamplus magnetovallimortis]
MFWLFSGKRRATMRHRLGLSSLISKKKEGMRRIWVHALSVGEAKSIIPLVRLLEKNYISKGFEIIVTVSTQGGFEVARQYFTKRENRSPSIHHSSISCIKREPVASNNKSSLSCSNKEFTPSNKDSLLEEIPCSSEHIHEIGYFPYDFFFQLLLSAKG